MANDRHNTAYRRIKDLREDCGLTQTEIAKLLSTTQRTYSRYETGSNSTIPLDILIKLADIYNVSIDYLLERTDIAKPYPKSQKRKNQK